MLLGRHRFTAFEVAAESVSCDRHLLAFRVHSVDILLHYCATLLVVSLYHFPIACMTV